jgi:hypothetical protein
VPDDFDAELRQAGVGALETAVAEPVAIVVGELKAARAERMQDFDVVRVSLQHRRVLEIHDDGGPAVALRALEVRRRQGNHQCVGVFRRTPPPLDQCTDGGLQIAPGQALDDARVARGFQRAKLGLLPFLAEGQPVDHEGALVQAGQPVFGGGRAHRQRRRAREGAERLPPGHTNAHPLTRRNEAVTITRRSTVSTSGGIGCSIRK